MICQSFTVGPPFASGGLNFCSIFQVGDSPKFFSPMQYFADSPKFYAANVSRYTVSSITATKPTLQFWVLTISIECISTY